MALYIKLDSTLCCMDLSLQLLQITKARKSLLANKNLHYLELPKYLYKHPLWGEPCFQQGFEPNGLLVSYSSVNKHTRILKQIEQCCTKITAITKGNLDHSKVRKKQPNHEWQLCLHASIACWCDRSSTWGCLEKTLSQYFLLQNKTAG